MAMIKALKIIYIKFLNHSLQTILKKNHFENNV